MKIKKKIILICSIKLLRNPLKEINQFQLHMFECDPQASVKKRQREKEREIERERERERERSKYDS